MQNQSRILITSFVLLLVTLATSTPAFANDGESKTPTPNDNKAQAIRLLKEAALDNSSIPTKNGEPWILIDTDGTAKEVKLQVKPWRGYGGDEDPSDYISDVSIVGQKSSGFLVRGLKIKPGKLDFYGPAQELALGQVNRMPLIKKELYPQNFVAVYATGEVADRDKFESTSSTTRRYELTYSDRTHKHKFFTAHNVIFPISLKWVGDLNGDGYPDLILSANTHESGANSMSLYLTNRKDGKFEVNLAATLNEPGC